MRVSVALIAFLVLQGQAVLATALLATVPCLSPTALVATKDGRTLFIACATAGRVLQFDTASAQVTALMSVPESPLGLALSTNGTRLFVTCAGPESKVCTIDVAEHRIICTLPVGHTAMAPVLSPDGETLYVCNRFNHTVSVIDLVLNQEAERIPVPQEPVAAAITPAGRFLLVANHRHSGPADQDYVAAAVSVIDTAKAEVVKELHLPNGSGSLQDMRVSPDGKYAAVTHVVSQFKRPAAHVFPEWMNAAGLTLIDLGRLEVLGSVLLDDAGRGAANPWGLAWSGDGSLLVVTHAGTHEVSLIEFAPLLKAILDLPAPFDPTRPSPWLLVSKAALDEANYLPFISSPRRRLKLPEADLGPRAVVVAGNQAYVANYFSDTLSVIDLAATTSRVETIDLRKELTTDSTDGTDKKTSVSSVKSVVLPSPPAPNGAASCSPGWPGPCAKRRGYPGSRLGTTNMGRNRTQILSAMTLERRGEFYFHDASLCLQGWQSCASCHPGDARSDGLNWDLLNDGIGNPKNTKSLLLADETPPCMWLGVRDTAEAAVRSGIQHILFAKPTKEVATAIDAYLKSLKPVPSPFLVQSPKSKVQSLEGRDHGPANTGASAEWRLSEAAERGRAVFSRAGCAVCHPPGLFTDLRRHDVGTRRPFDKPSDQFDTPTLIEVWRTAPYLHDGSAATVREVLTTRNPQDQHGRTSGLSHQELDDLCAYVLSL